MNPNSKLHIEKLISFLKGKDNFNTQDISNFYKTLEPKIKRTTINWRIYTLTKNGIITRIGRGKYTLKKGVSFVPQVTRKLKLINKKLRNEFPFLTICLWSSSILKEFAIHQSNKDILLIEVEREAAQSVFHYLKEKNYNAFIKPTGDILENYASVENNYIIVKSLISESPIQKIQGVITVTIEKILVDIFCDNVIFSAYQGNEMRTIFLRASAKYLINKSKLLRYADRRGKKEEIKNYLVLINGNK